MEGYRGFIFIVIGLSWLLGDIALSDVANQMPDEKENTTDGDGEYYLVLKLSFYYSLS